MLEKFMKNKNEFHIHALGFTLIAIIAVLKYEMIETSLIFFGLSTAMVGIGTLYNQNKEQGQKLDKILENQKVIIGELLKNGRVV